MKEVCDNHKRYNSFENALRADGYDTLPISAGIVGTKVGGMFGGVPGAFIGGVSAGGIVTVYVKIQKENGDQMRKMLIMHHREGGLVYVTHHFV